jgi:orotate phosphoribosyltransferase
MRSFDDPHHIIADFLLQIKAVRLQPLNPFTWASGLKSPIYCDNRKTLSYPKIRNYIRQQFVHEIESRYAKPDVIAGIATGGIPMGVLVAQDLGLPFVYVRAQAKQHGLSNMIEGDLKEQQQVLVIEDLVSTGKSSLQAVAELRKAKARVDHMLSIFTYGFDSAAKSFLEAQCSLVSLTNYHHLIEVAVQNQYIQPKDFASLTEWQKNPQAWSDAQNL